MDALDTKDLCGSDTGRGYNMMTASGKPYWPCSPRPEDVRIEDIGRHLSRICRFNGALRDAVDVYWDDYSPGLHGVFLHEAECQEGVIVPVQIYSVAQHSVFVCDHVEDPALKLPALLHDAAEGYCHDIIKPIKGALGDAYASIARLNETAVANRFGFDPDLFDHPDVKEADYRAVLTERRDVLTPGSLVDWGTPKTGPWPEQIIPRLPSAAYYLFMGRFNDLYKGD